MSYDETMFGTAPPFSFEETEGYRRKRSVCFADPSVEPETQTLGVMTMRISGTSPKTSGAAAVRTADIITASAVCGPF